MHPTPIRNALIPTKRYKEMQVEVSDGVHCAAAECLDVGNTYLVEVLDVLRVRQAGLSMFHDVRTLGRQLGTSVSAAVILMFQVRVNVGVAGQRDDIVHHAHAMKDHLASHSQTTPAFGLNIHRALMRLIQCSLSFVAFCFRHFG